MDNLSVVVTANQIPNLTVLSVDIWEVVEDFTWNGEVKIAYITEDSPKFAEWVEKE